MKIQNVCCCCGRTIENSFVYCPWCGNEVMASAKPEVHERPLYEYIECIADDVREQRIFNIEYSLNQLENDLSKILEECSQ